jgi:hypothetical protein
VKHFISALTIFLIAFSCQKSNNKISVERAFYFWKNQDRYNDSSFYHANKNSISKLYVKYFEVDYSEAKGNYPYEKIDEYSHFFSEMENVTIVPTIFIKNEIFKYNEEKDLDKLADNIIFLIEKRNKVFTSENSNTIIDNEIQLDCDWTKTTKDKYFYLLKSIKKRSKTKISCTLRLYPYKYSEIMGVPPVDKVTLMCYNLIKPLSDKHKNSILDIDELSKYLNVKRKYPIHLDIALPVYSWSQLYQNDHFIKLIDISSNTLESFCVNTEPLWYTVEKDTSMNWNDYYRVGDRIKCEEVSSKDIDKAISIIKKNIDLDNSTTIILFDLSETVFKNYSYEEINNFYSAFTR